MPRRPVLPVLVLAAVALTGCTSTVTGTATAPGVTVTSSSSSASAGTGSEQQLVAWADEYCGAFVNSSFFDLTEHQPDLGGASGPAAAKKLMLDYIGRFDTAVGTIITSLHGIGAAPDPAGDQLVDQTTSALSKVRAALQSAQAKIAAADPDDPAEFAAAFRSIAPDVATLEQVKDPAAGLDASPVFEHAGDQAANCQKLKAIATAGSPTS